MSEEIKLLSQIASKIVRKQEILEKSSDQKKITCLAKYIVTYFDILSGFKEELKDKIKRRTELIAEMVQDIKKYMKEKISEVNKDFADTTEIIQSKN
jgi:uncharacterized protein YydD (DUF2326 family)